MVGEARHGAERIRQIVRSLRIFAGAGQGRREHLDVRQVIDIAANLALSQVRARARLVRDYGDVAVVLADDAQLAQVFMNLLVNAAQAIPEGQPDHHEIRISTHTGPLGRVVVEVWDTGSGMSPEVLARALDPFFTTKPVGGGVGLGLSFCRGVVGALGGELVIESAPGEGTLVRVSLPPAEMPAAPLADTALSPAPRQRILVVDEEPRVGNTLRWALKDHDIVIVTDARLALRRIEQGERYALILCDLMMPGMTGMDLHAALAIQCPTQAERTVFVTGGGLTPEAETFLKRASNVRLEKPFEPYQLRAVVRALATPLGVPGTD
jgi:CheY-like chemotaxis protein/two-component sensor histidine kinase